MSVLLTHLRELVSERPVVAPDDRTVEVKENTWSVRRDVSDPATTHAVVAALREVSEAWLDSARPHVPTTFYAWYDEMAGQLRLSLTSSTADDLPFGRDPARRSPIHRGRVACGSAPGTILWEDLEPADEEIAFNEPEASPLAVWAQGSD